MEFQILADGIDEAVRLERERSEAQLASLCSERADLRASLAALERLHGGALRECAALAAERDELRAERDRARESLAERKWIDRAREILMDERGMRGAAAYEWLRREAMDGCKRIGALAREIVEGEREWRAGLWEGESVTQERSEADPRALAASENDALLERMTQVVELAFREPLEGKIALVLLGDRRTGLGISVISGHEGESFEQCSEAIAALCSAVRFIARAAPAERREEITDLIQAALTGKPFVRADA